MTKVTRTASRLVVGGVLGMLLVAACGEDSDSSGQVVPTGVNPDAGAFAGDGAALGDAAGGNMDPGNGPGSGGSANANSDSGAAGSGSGADGSALDGGPVPSDPVGCHEIGTACVTTDECCTGVCDPVEQICSWTPDACTAADEACETGPECCTFSCVEGQCSSVQCTADGETCLEDAECCGGMCVSGTCSPLNIECRTSGNPCADNDDCCSHFCKDDVCSGPSYCSQSGDVCNSDQECCAGLCDKEAGAELGVCALAPASGAGGCLSAGEVCSAGVTNDGGVASYDGGTLPICGGECCSRACFPYGPTGVLICQPPSGCHPTGELCQSDLDCCGSETRPDGDTSQIVCNKEGSNPIGRCDNGNSCTPAGGICRLQAVECSANANCCAGNVLQNNTCVQDNLGIPRCLAAEIDCTDPANYVGEACASSADCCNLPCVPNPQGDPPFVCAGECVDSGGTCTNNADCCSGIPCLLSPGSTMGTCAAGPPGDDCAEYGQGCDDASDCCNGIPCNGGFCVLFIR